MQRISLWIALMLATAGVQAADLYKWTDVDGVVHYSDSEPPAQVKATKMHVAGTKTAGDTDAAANDANDAGAAATKVETPVGTLASSVQSAERRCAQARANLEVLQSKLTVGMDTSGTGKAEMLDDKQRQAEVAKAQTVIATYCK
jgi:hypothetical protein